VGFEQRSPEQRSPEQRGPEQRGPECGDKVLDKYGLWQTHYEKVIWRGGTVEMMLSDTNYETRTKSDKY
jgi:hypothetical protein